MKALLLVGGLATRLRPLSITRPKCLFPLGGTPIIDHLLKNLGKAGCTDAILAVNNLANKITEHLGPEKHGVKIHYSHEKTPLGTGGPIKLAQEQLKDDDFLVLNGDILSFIDYKKLINTHNKTGNTATLTLTHVKDPSRYGVVKFGKDQTIQQFVEKPTREQAPSNWINAGCYALNPKILDIIPSGKKVSIEREVFPKIAEEKQLIGYKYWGDWIDIGVPDDYLKADKILGPPVYGDHTVIGNSKIKNSVIWENTTIGDNCKIYGSIIGANVDIGDNVTVESGSVIADNTKIKENIEIGFNCKMWPGSLVDFNLDDGTEFKGI